MGYQVKWVEENLGVTRKALRLYEEKGLMPANKGGQYRSYDEDDLDRIWTIKVLQGMGYSLREIVALVKDENFDFQESIGHKVLSLEAKKADAERLLGYAKMIQLTGRFPSRPKDMGSITFDAFQEKVLEGWNVKKYPEAEKAQFLLTQVLDQPQEKWGESELGLMLLTLSDFGMNRDVLEKLLCIDTIQKSIISRSSQGAASLEVQLLVGILYEQLCKFYEKEEMTQQAFGRLYASSIMEGLSGESSQQRYGTEGCAFLADAIAIFAGFKNYEDSI